MLLRRPISALLRPLLAASASPAATLRHSAAASAALWRRPGLVSPRPAPFYTSVGYIAPANSALACLDPLEVLRLRLGKERGICIDRLVKRRGVCPECGGGAPKTISFRLRVSEDGSSAEWRCHRAKCGWKGGLRATGESKSPITSNTEPKLPLIITEESLQLQPLCPETNISNIPQSRSDGSVESASNGIVVPSITTVIGQMDAISELDPNDKLYMFAIELFRNKDNREIFSALKTNRVKLLWLKSQKEEHDNKRH